MPSNFLSASPLKSLRKQTIVLFSYLLIKARAQKELDRKITNRASHKAVGTIIYEKVLI